MDINSSYISSATLRNWNKLNTSETDRLTRRANKSRSVKKISPDSYIKSDGLNQILSIILECNAPLYDIMYSLCKKKLSFVGDNNPNVLKFDNEFGKCSFLNFDIPGEILMDVSRDWLGYIYQSLLPEGTRNVNGQYYTNSDIVQDMLNGLKVPDSCTFLDPCCGSGAFLLNVSGVSLSQLYGVDSDIIAVMLCKANLIAKYTDDFTYPNVFCFDFLIDDTLPNNNSLYGKEFDFIYTNPPWGTSKVFRYESSVIKSKERASLFLEKSMGYLKTDGEMCFLLPSSLLKIKAHSDIRRFLLKSTSIKSVSLYKEKFNGVFTDFFSVKLKFSRPENGQDYMVYKEGKSIPIKIPAKDISTEIVLHDFFDSTILKKMESQYNDSLSHSVWALGIVTGDNKNKVKKECFKDAEVIYTGKDINKYVIKAPSNYILYDRLSFQQCARDEIYRSSEKLVYKFISKSLCFAYDNTRSLFLNSANILIPDIKGMSVKTVLAFLNSELYSFYYAKKYSDIKILRGNLETIPFPEISKEQNEKISNMVSDIICKKIDRTKDINKEIYSIFGFGEEIITHIKAFLYGDPA